MLLKPAAPPSAAPPAPVDEGAQAAPTFAEEVADRGRTLAPPRSTFFGRSVFLSTVDEDDGRIVLTAQNGYQTGIDTQYEKEPKHPRSNMGVRVINPPDTY